MKTVNPATEEIIQDWNWLNEFELEAVLDQCHDSQRQWRQVPLSERKAFLPRLKIELERMAKPLASMMTREMGKPMGQALSEVKKSQTLCDHYLDLDISINSDPIQVPGLAESYVSYQPKGVLLGIMPWNFPLWQVVRFAIPSIVMGNGILLKHAPGTFGCGELIGNIFSKVGLPEGLFQNIRVDVDQVKGLIADERIQGVSFTGSTTGGKQVAEVAGRYMKKTLFELGGSDAYLVLNDADVELAAKKLVSSRMMNNGQSCVAAKRWIVLPMVRKPFTEAVLGEMKAYHPMDPQDSECLQGPMARKDLLEQLHDQVLRATKQGAKVLMGGKPLKQKGWFYPATVLDNVSPGQTALSEELFGPVASIIPAKDEQQAVAFANSSSYGLGGGVFSKDISRAEALVREHLQCGMVAINDFVKSFPEVPFGGEKESGYGRELGYHGLYEFCNVKTVLVGETTS